MKIKQIVPVILVLLIGLLAAISISRSEKQQTDSHHEHGEKPEEHNQEDHEDEKIADKILNLSPEAAQKSGIHTSEVKGRTLSLDLELSGQVILNSDKVAHVVPQIKGIVREVNKSLGDKVRKGELLAILNSRELADAKQEYIESVHHLELMGSGYRREKQLWDKQINSEEDFLKSQHALEEAKIQNYASRQKLLTLGLSEHEVSSLELNPRQELANYKIRSPFSGTIIEKHVSIGEALKEDSLLFIIADLSVLWADITVYAKDLEYIKPGQEIIIKANDLNLQSKSKIFYLGPVIGAETRSAKAHALILNPESLWRPGLFITASAAGEKKQVSMAVKTDSIHNINDQEYVFIKNGNTYKAKEVVIGRKSNEWTEIISGLRQGEQYVSENSYILKADLEKSSASHEH